MEEFLHTWESIENGGIRVVICGEKITIDQALIVKQFNVSVEGVVDATNALVKEAQIALKNIVKLDAFVNKEQWSIIQIEEGIPCQVCNNLANYLPMRKVSLFQQPYCHHF